MMRLLFYGALAAAALWLLSGVFAKITATFGSIFWWMFP